MSTRWMRAGLNGRRSSWLLILAIVGCGPSPTAEPKSPAALSQKAALHQKQAGELTAEEELRAGQLEEKKGQWVRAESHFRRAEQKGQSPIARAQLLLALGRYQELLHEFASSSEPELSYLSARAQRQLGQLQPALDRLLAITAVGDKLSSPSTLLARALLLSGEIELERGQREAAELSLGKLIKRAQSAPPDLAAPQLVYAGRAAALLRQHELSNELFNQAETQLDEIKFETEFRDLLLFRGALFLEKNDHAEARQIAAELVEHWPFDLEVRCFEALILSETQFDFAAAEKLALDIIKVNSVHAGALFLLAGIELRDMNLKAALAYVEQGLAANSRNLELLSMRAAIRFLNEDQAGFETQLSEINGLSPGSVRPHLVASEYAEWEHRYPDIEKLMRRASRLDRDAAEVRTRLGLTLVRAGSDAAGVVELNRAYELDPYNVRVINTLNLYEKIIPQSYVSIERGPFRYRFPQAEAALLERYVPDLLETAYEEMRQRYNYTPRAPIDIELYETRPQFAVRTSGVPEVGIQGVCFGHKLATVSPVATPGNLGMTLWHELGHVFHIGLSNYRVPRYLTEGLAEWETLHRGVGWSRELDRELYEVRTEGGLPKLSQMSRAFTHAKGAQDIAAAYYASGILSEWLVSRYGQQKIVQLLTELGKGQLAEAVVPKVLGSTWAELDADFESHLTEKLNPIAQQFTPQMARVESRLVRPLLKKNPHSLELQLQLSLALLGEGKLKEAKAGLLKLQGRAKEQASYGLIRVALAEDDKKGARSLLDELFKSGSDGYLLRMLSGRLYLADQQEELALAQFNAAAGFDPQAEEARKVLVDYYRRHAQPQAELEQLRIWAKLSEHQAAVHQRLLELLIEQGHSEEAMAAARLAIWVDLAGVETHRLAGLAFARGGSWKQAEFEWESALLCPLQPAQLVRLGHTWTEELKRLGRHAQATKVAERIAKAVNLALAEGGVEPEDGSTAPGLNSAAAPEAN